MKARLFLATLLMALLTCLSAEAQVLKVYYVAGNVTQTTGGKKKAVALNDALSMQTQVSVPYGGKLELLNEQKSERITIKVPGTGTIKTLLSASGNTVSSLSERYVAYVKKQMTNKGLVSKQRYSDFATVTRQVDSVAVDSDEPEDPFRSAFDSFKKDTRKRFDSFRDSCNQVYLKHVRESWRAIGKKPPVPQPAVKKIPQATAPDTDKFSFRQLVQTIKEKLSSKKKGNKSQSAVADVKSNESATDKVNPNGKAKANANAQKANANTQVASADADKKVEGDALPAANVLNNLYDGQLSTAAPVEEIKPVKEESIEIRFDEGLATMPFSFFGTDMEVRLDESRRINIGEIKPTRVADALAHLSTKEYDNLLYDCLQQKKKYALCDWAYTLMLKSITDQFCGESTNEAALLMGYLMYQSGYKIKFGYDKTNKLYVLLASKHTIYDKGGYMLDDFTYYPMEDVEGDLYICNAQFPKEQGLSLVIDTDQRLKETQSEMRTVKSRLYPDLTMTYSINKNLIDFYDTYPSSCLNNDFTTKWVMYALTPLNEDVKNQIYPSLRQQLDGLTDEEKVACILNLIQTGYEYQYDDVVWGGDRAFFAEETLYYPYCDCEDRAILFSRLVRDIIGLECVLVYYPGHLAAAVNFKTPVAGDYYTLNGKRFTICDPTYINAGIGMQMPEFKNGGATLIPIK